MTSKPFIVSVELEFGVMAENEDEARRALSRCWVADEFEMMLGQGGTGIEILPFNRMPIGWNEDCILYDEKTGPDTTAQEALKMTK